MKLVQCENLDTLFYEKINGIVTQRRANNLKRGKKVIPGADFAKQTTSTSATATDETANETSCNSTSKSIDEILFSCF